MSLLIKNTDASIYCFTAMKFQNKQNIIFVHKRDSWTKCSMNAPVIFYSCWSKVMFLLVHLVESHGWLSHLRCCRCFFCPQHVQGVHPPPLLHHSSLLFVQTALSPVCHPATLQHQFNTIMHWSQDKISQIYCKSWNLCISNKNTPAGP